MAESSLAAAASVAWPTAEMTTGLVLVPTRLPPTVMGPSAAPVWMAPLL